MHKSPPKYNREHIMKLRRIINQKGQGVMEYIILSALIGIFCLGAISKIGKRLETKGNNIAKKIQEIKIN